MADPTISAQIFYFEFYYDDSAHPPVMGTSDPLLPRSIERLITPTHIITHLLLLQPTILQHHHDNHRQALLQTASVVMCKRRYSDETTPRKCLTTDHHHQSPSDTHASVQIAPSSVAGNDSCKLFLDLGRYSELGIRVSLSKRLCSSRKSTFGR